MTEPDPVEAYVRRRRRVRVVVAVAVLIVAGLGGWLLTHPRALDSLTGSGYDLRVDLDQREPEPSVLNGVDLARVHGELLPNWWLAAADGKRRRAAGEAATALAEALAGDPVLAATFEEGRLLMLDGPLNHVDALYAVARSWSDHLDDHDAPWFVEPGVQSGWFFFKSFHVVADVDLDVAGQARRVRVMRRMDGTNIVEGWTGHSGEAGRGAQVTMDRVISFAADTVWPLLDPELDEATLDPILLAFSPAVRAEAERVLSGEHLALLRKTAPARDRVLRALGSQTQRHHCTNFRMRLDWLGLSGSSLASIQAQARDDAGRRRICPGVKPVEAAALLEGSTTLAGTKGLEVAFGAMVSWLARGTAVHEARHIADGKVAPVVEQADGDEGDEGDGGDGGDAAARSELACPGCPPDFPVWGRAELSAYLASFATDGAPVTSLLRACLAADQGYSSSHLAAMELINESMALNGCRSGPPPALQELAREMEQDLFGRAEPITVPDSWPAVFPIGIGLNRGG